MKKLEFDSKILEIPLDQLDIAEIQVRTIDVGKDIQELADNIAKVGLIQPILVYPVKDDKFEIVSGQRRFLAHKLLKAKTIRAQVVKTELDDLDLKIISLSENVCRSDLASKNEKDVCLALWYRYHDIDLIIQETGLPPKRVKKWTQHQTLAPKLKNLVDSGSIDIDEALRAQKAASISGTFDEEKAIALAEEMKPMNDGQRRNLEKIVIAEPDISLEDAIEQSKKTKTIQIFAIVTENVNLALKSYSTEERISQRRAASVLIEEGLTSKGYLSENSDSDE